MGANQHVGAAWRLAHSLSEELADLDDFVRNVNSSCDLQARLMEPFCEATQSIRAALIEGYKDVVREMARAAVIRELEER